MNLSYVLHDTTVIKSLMLRLICDLLLLITCGSIKSCPNLHLILNIQLNTINNNNGIFKKMLMNPMKWNYFNNVCGSKCTGHEEIKYFSNDESQLIEHEVYFYSFVEMKCTIRSFLMLLWFKTNCQIFLFMRQIHLIQISVI